MRISFIHLNIFASNEKKTKITVLMTDLIHTQMINPTKILKRPSFSAAATAATATASTIIKISGKTNFSEITGNLLLRSVGGNKFLRSRRCHRINQSTRNNNSARFDFEFFVASFNFENPLFFFWFVSQLWSLGSLICHEFMSSNQNPPRQVNVCVLPYSDFALKQNLGEIITYHYRQAFSNMSTWRGTHKVS